MINWFSSIFCCSLPQRTSGSELHAKPKWWVKLIQLSAKFEHVCLRIVYLCKHRTAITFGRKHLQTCLVELAAVNDVTTGWLPIWSSLPTCLKWLFGWPSTAPWPKPLAWWPCLTLEAANWSWALKTACMFSLSRIRYSSAPVWLLLALFTCCWPSLMASWILNRT